MWRGHSGDIREVETHQKKRLKKKEGARERERERELFIDSIHQTLRRFSPRHYIRSCFKRQTNKNRAANKDYNKYKLAFKGGV
jgi:hypothetical protein